MAEAEIYQSQVLTRTFQIFDILANESSGLGVTTLATKLGLHKSSAHRLIMVLEANRFVEKNGSTGKYQLGSRILELGLSALSRLDIYEVARPHLRRLVADSGETAHIGVMRDNEITSIVNVRSSRALHAPSEVGTRHAAHCSALGKAILAFGPMEDVERFLRDRTLEGFTRNTITSPSMFIREIESVRSNGYALDDEEREEGLRCIGAPVRDSTGEVIAAVSVAGPVFRITRDRIDALAGVVMGSAGQISASLGYRPKTQVQGTETSASSEPITEGQAAV